MDCKPGTFNLPQGKRITIIQRGDEFLAKFNDPERSRYVGHLMRTSCISASSAVGELIGALLESAVYNDLAINVILAGIQGSQWQSIETAPMDGSSVDLTDGNHRAIDYAFRDGHWCNSENLIFKAPTHWMRVPGLPACRVE